IAPIPLGGYVKMLGQEDTATVDINSVPASQREVSFACKPLWQRSAIVAAGPVANFLLAIFVYWVITISYGVSGIAPVISGIIEDSPAEIAGLGVGDEILAVDGEDTIIWQQVTLKMLSRLGETGNLELTINPAGSTNTRNITIPIQAWMGYDTSPDPIRELGIVTLEIPAVIDSIIPGSRAESGGLQAGDTILSADGRAIRGWSHWVDVIQQSPELELEVVVQRGESPLSLLLRPESSLGTDGNSIGYIGASVRETTLEQILGPDARRTVNYGPFTAIGPALQETWDKSVFVLQSVKKMIIGLISVKNINGPITIAQVAGETASYGLEVYLGFLALLSISLGVLNLLPIPVLDGGHLLYYSIEAIIRRPVPERIQAWGLQLGLLIISGIMVLAIYNDVTRIL
ncbi:MAG: RIP metalloprotease RseP, partial [Gammaproteobacteria bacterium]